MNLQKSTHTTVLLNGILEKADKLQPIPSETAIVYEVIRLISGIPLFVESHLERMNHSLLIAGFPAPLEVASVKRAINKLTEACSVRNQNLRINVWQRGGTMCWAGFFVESSYPEPSFYAEGVKTGLLRMERDNPNAKVWQADLKDAAARACEKCGFYEMILVDAHGFISEGSRSNLFFTQGNTLVTAPDSKVLGGITRQKLLELIEKNGIPLVKRDIPVSELESFDGAFITGTSIHLLPVNQIDAWQRPSPQHPVIASLMKEFKAIVAAYEDTYNYQLP